MSDTPARFRFSSPGLDVEFEGHPEFVAGQIQNFHGRIEAELDRVKAAGAPRAATPAPASAAPAAQPASPPPSQPAPSQPVPSQAAAPKEAPTLDQFYRSANARAGRGALQDSILLFGYFLREYRNTNEFSVDNLVACFSLVGVAPPKSLANTLGVMRRSQRLFDTGSRRGLYQLTDKATHYVRGLLPS